MAILDYFNRRRSDRLEPTTAGDREKGPGVCDGKARLLILALALIVSIVIVINGVPAYASKGGHGDKGGHGGRGGGHGHGNHGGHGGDDNGDNGDNGDPGPGPSNGGGGKSRGDRGGGGECAALDGVNPCIVARPKRDRQPVEVAPGVFKYYGTFGQVIGTSIVTSSPDLAPKIIEPIPAKAQPVAIVKKPAQDLEHEKAHVVRKRTIQPPEKSADPILGDLIIQAIERPVIEPVQSVPACECATE